MDKKRILILSDSLALPRELPELCPLESTWPHLLRESEYFSVHQISIGGATAPDLLKQVNYYKPVHPDIVVVQSGIVDSAPRFLTRFELEAIRKLPFNFVRKSVMGVFNTPRVRKWRRITYTPPEQFERSMQDIKKGFDKSTHLAIGIVLPIAEYELALPGITGNIARYNEILSQCFKGRFIDMKEFPPDGVMSDHHHINAVGHRFIYDRIVEQINKISN